MKTIDIQTELMRRFEAADLDDAPALVVWDDPEGEFEEALDGLDLPGVEILRDEDGSRFSIKRRLNALGAGKRALLYRKRAAHDVRGDWFADVVYYAQHFQADLASLQLEELGCADTSDMRAALRQHQAFLSKKTNMKRLRSLREGFDTPNELHVAVMAAALGKGVCAEYANVIAVYLCRALDEGGEVPYRALEDAGAAAAFESMLSRATGFSGDVSDAHAVSRHILVTSLASAIDPGYLSGLEKSLSVPHAQLCREIVHAWAAEPDLADALYDEARRVEEDCNLRGRFSALDVRDIRDADSVPCISECVASALLRAVAEGSDVAEAASEAFDRRRSMPWFSEVEGYYEALLACVGLGRLYRSSADGFHMTDSRAVWEAYTSGLFQVDAAYRAFYRAFGRCLRTPNVELDDDLKAAVSWVENLYKNWFLAELNGRWIDLAGADFERAGYVDGVPRLTEFSMAHVEPAARRGKVFVVVSDALRFEVAEELSRRLEATTKGRAELLSAQAPFPSVTAVGMAALLPHASIELSCEDGSLAVSVDGSPIRSREERQRILRSIDPGAVAVGYEDFSNMRRDERRSLVEGASIVYIYHNVIDATGDDAKTEDDVFDACADAVEEISGLVSVITRELRASNVIVTADHGFLYTHSSLDELEHVSVEEVSGTVLRQTRRYLLAEAGATAPYLASVAMTANGAADLVGLTPRGCGRIRRQGAGERYVHGGISLQELCVPVLRFKNLRAGSAAYVEVEPVEIEPVNMPSVITSTLFRLALFQTEPASGKRLACAYELAVEDSSGNLVSDVVRVVADKVSAEATEREFTVQFAFKAGVDFSGGRAFNLVARYADGGTIAWKREIRIEIAFAPIEDFDW